MKRAPNVGDLVMWFEAIGIIIAKRGIEVQIILRDEHGLTTFKTLWMRRDAVEVVSEGR